MHKKRGRGGSGRSVKWCAPLLFPRSLITGVDSALDRSDYAHWLLLLKLLLPLVVAVVVRGESTFPGLPCE